MRNFNVPTDAFGLPTKNRRARLTIVPAATVGIGALDAPTPAGSSHPDAALFVKEPGIRQLIAKWTASADAQAAAETRYFAELPAKTPHPWDISAMAAYVAESDRLSAKYNVDALEKASDDLCGEVARALKDLCGMNAKTLDGVKLKARMAWFWEHDSADCELTLSAIENLLTL